MITEAASPKVDRVTFSAGARRADWRFLLPAPLDGRFERLVILGGTRELRDELAQLGIARAVDATLRHDRPADAIVVLADAIHRARHAASVLAPGGVFYCEVDRRRPRSALRTPRRLLRMLSAAGLEAAGVWWVIPDFEHAKRFVPLDGPSAIRWYFESVYPQSSALRTLIVAAARTFTGGRSDRFARIAPCFSVVAVADRRAASPPSVLADPRVADVVGQTSSCALVTSGQDDGSRVVMLPFREGGRPSVVVKVARTPTFNEHTDGEQTTLALLRSRLGPELRTTIPTPCYSGRWNGLAVGVESWATGQSVVVSSAAWRSRTQSKLEDLRAATDWLVAFHREWQIERLLWDEHEMNRFVDQPLRQYRETFGVTTFEERLFERISRFVRDLRGAALPIVLQHNDFGPWNVHRDRGRIKVIDWEFDGADLSRRAGLAGMDLVYFIVHWVYLVRGVRNVRGRRRWFVEVLLSERHTAPEAAARAALDSYVRRLDIDPGFLPAVVALTWVRHAIDRVARGTDPAGIRNQYAEYVGLIARHSDALFRWRESD